MDEGVKLVHGLSHRGLAHDKKLAETVRSIDVIVGAYSHNRMQEAAVVGGTLIVQAGAHGSDLGRLDIDMQDRKIVAHQCNLITLDNNCFASDAKTAALTEAHRFPFEEAQLEPIE